MKRTRRAIVLLLVGLVSTQAQGASRRLLEELPLIESGVGTLEAGSRSFPLDFVVTRVGPMVSLEPIVELLGGQLKLGPMRQSHELSLGASLFVFGPESLNVTLGEEAFPISQAPRSEEEITYVPIDLLAALYREQLGFEFLWDNASRSLRVQKVPVRSLQVSIEMVHLQGVTTLVMQFPEKPRYRVERSADSVTVELLGDVLVPGGAERLPSDRLVRGVSLGERSIQFALAPNTEARDYELQNPFRLVFDVYPGSTSTSAPVRPVVPAQPQRSPGIHTIAIDPGHGGGDTGAIGPTGAQEKDLTLLLAQSLRTQLQRRLPVKVILTRNEDAELPLDTRTAIANQQKADLFVSLHLNSGLYASARGAETYFLSLEATDESAARAAEEENRSAGASSDDPLYDLQLILWDLAQSRHLSASQGLASLIQEELNDALGLRNRGVKQAPFSVLIGASMPAVLVELGFLSNPDEEEKLKDPAYRSELVDALVRAITRYKAQREPSRAVAEANP